MRLWFSLTPKQQQQQKTIEISFLRKAMLLSTSFFMAMRQCAMHHRTFFYTALRNPSQGFMRARKTTNSAAS